MKKSTKGFTLAELLIVVAIIAVLVAISIPVFTSQLHKARVAADWANVRAYYAELQYDFMETEKIDESKLREPGPDPITSFNLTGQKIRLY
ncbi:MAG: prepilin-type N-terminal cleavage/methylation domain-containing protein [Bulleidia sp.]|nr:prepilin-type N-terminal cleavage/methylation domain-containing protein [Bulleidia sp.]